MSLRKQVRVFTLTLLILVSGCVALPFDQPTEQERPVQFVANNSANSTQTFSVYVVELPANVTFRRSDGNQGTLDIEQGISTVNLDDNRTYTKFEVPDSARLHGQFRVSPNGSNQSSIPNPPRHFAVVVTVAQEQNEIIGFLTANCDDLALAKLRVSQNSGHVSGTYSCV